VEFFLFLALLIAIALVIFAVQNAAVVTVSFLTFRAAGSLAFILIMVFAAGILTGVLMAVPAILRRGSSLRAQRKRIRQLEDELKLGGQSYEPSREERSSSEGSGR
jgi:putative membrane protein